RMSDPQYTLDYDRMMRRQWISVNGVTEDDIDAFVLNFRLLVQDRDGFSIRSLAESVYVIDDVPDRLRKDFFSVRERWMRFLETVSIIRHSSESRNYCNRELFDILIYGGIAHSDPTKVDHFLDITTRGAYSSFVCGWLLHILRKLFDLARDMRDINAVLIRHIVAARQAT
ncbi:MAG: hypothetical protein ABIU05_09000, partial [Nitrospirales bacterium]